MSLADRLIYNPIFQSSSVFATQRIHACVDEHSPPPTALLRCIIVQSEAGETWARSTVPPISTVGVVTSQPWLHYPDLDVWGSVFTITQWSNLPWDEPVHGITAHVLLNFGFSFYLIFFKQVKCAPCWPIYWTDQYTIEKLVHTA